MPPKATAEATEEPSQFMFERDKMIKKFNVDNYIMRSKISPIDVPRRPKKDPVEKLKERINTYRNLRKMKTDYKNYVHRYGSPSFYVPEEIWRVV